jgi:predicted transcriptional regulator
MPVKKNEVLELLRDLPDEVDADDLIYRLYLMQKLERSEAAAEAGDLIPHEEVVKRSAEWLK